MTKDELIAKQQLEIEDYKNQVAEFNAARKSVAMELFSIGAPLNDNCSQFNCEQKIVLRRIAGHLDIE